MTWLYIDGLPLPCVDDRQQLTADAIEQMAAWSFWWHDERNMVMLTGEAELID